jgi:hypothetical protein
MRVPRLYQLALAATVAALCSPDRGAACKIGSPPPPTLVTEYGNASLVLLGRITDVKPGTPPDKGTCEFHIEVPFKKHPLMAGKERLTLPIGNPDLVDKRYLIFFDVYKGKVDPYRGVEVPPGSNLADYFRGGLSVKDGPLSGRVRHAFDYLRSPATDVATDAFQELIRLPYKELRKAAKTLPASEIERRLGDPKTPRLHYGIYALMLTACGTADDAEALRRLQGAPDERQMIAYVLLRPREGWAYLRAVLADGNVSFHARFACLRALRFFHDERPDVIPRADLIEGSLAAMVPPDMTDLALEDLRRWKHLGFSERVLRLVGKQGYTTPIIRRAILRYALSCPGPRAAAFVQEQRRLDPEWVKETEELFALEGDILPNRIE